MALRFEWKHVEPVRAVLAAAHVEIAAVHPL
jgi:hypothetical protein